ncbi:hypothetical protein [Bradyrhizobium sp. URHD0069]|uniref:hypothetical protein n=1 Tax=Bradyrhizobium sp. URHD0069 TaxID=1380355 RepID=UPI0012DD78F7|nr:hypothetical protein [Bradyrhizobium sp. URHD0069]
MADDSITQRAPLPLARADVGAAVRSLVSVFWLSIVLGGCAADANTSFIPEFLKQPAPKVDVDQPPDVASIVRSDITTIFAAGSLSTSIKAA